MLRISSHRLLHRVGRTLTAGAFLYLAGCEDSQTGTFNGAASEKLAAEKGLAPGTKAQKAAPPTAGGLGKVPRAPGGAAPSPD